MIFGWVKRLWESTRLKVWYERHERALLSSFLIGGFLLDFFTFRTLNIQTTLIVLAIHLCLAAATMLYVFRFDDQGKLKHPFWNRLRFAAPLVTQLAFGSLLSMSFLFYWFSGALSASWPIFTLLVALIIFNESFRHAYVRPVVQVALFTFVLFSYFTLAFPFLLNSLSPWLIFLGGVVGLILSLLFITTLIRLAPGLKIVARWMTLTVCLLFVGMNTLHLLNVIPPIPLSLREARVYYSVRRLSTGYERIGEPQSIWNNILQKQVLYQGKSERVYVFTAIYSPAKLNTVIYHRWELYDPGQNRWVNKDRISFPIIGGRADGYNGYTSKPRLTPGAWRVSVETERGQVLGRIRFTYVGAD